MIVLSNFLCVLFLYRYLVFTRQDIWSKNEEQKFFRNIQFTWKVNLKILPPIYSAIIYIICFIFMMYPSEENLKFGNEDLADLLLDDGEKDVGVGFVFVLVSSIREKGCGSHTLFGGISLHPLDSSPTKDNSPTMDTSPTAQFIHHKHFIHWTLHPPDSSPTINTFPIIDTSPTGQFIMVLKRWMNCPVGEVSMVSEVSMVDELSSR